MPKRKRDRRERDGASADSRAAKKSGKPAKKSRRADPPPYTVIKSRRKVKRIIIAAVAVALVAGLLTWHFCTPTGIFESLQNSYSLHSTEGNAENGLAGSSFLQVDARYGRVDVLSDSYIEIYNSKGGGAYAARHGFSSPAMVSSAARTLVYDRGGSGLAAYTVRKRAQSLVFDGELYTAAISRNGTVAAAYKSNDYLSVVEVYSKSSKRRFVKNFPDSYVTALVLNPRGRYLAVATVRASGGTLQSDIYCFDARKGKELSRESYPGAYFNWAAPSGKRALFAGPDKAVYVTFRGGEQSGAELPGRILACAATPKGTVGFICGEESAGERRVLVYDKKGREKADFAFSGAAEGFSITENRVYILSAPDLYKYDFSGGEPEVTSLPKARMISASKSGAAVLSDARLQFVK